MFTEIRSRWLTWLRRRALTDTYLFHRIKYTFKHSQRPQDTLRRRLGQPQVCHISEKRKVIAPLRTRRNSKDGTSG